MKSYKALAGSVALGAALLILSIPVEAQSSDSAGPTISAPIVVRTSNSATTTAKPNGTNWLKAEVIRADAYTLVVREQANGLMIHTFTFAPAIKDRMQAILDRGGYQYGDKVKILYTPGQTVALKVHGKPSKPL